MSEHILLLTGSAPYLGGPHTWQPLRDAAADLEFRDLDLLQLELGDDFIAATKNAIKAAAQGARAVVAHGAVAPIVLDALAELQPGVPVLLISPMAVTRDSVFLRILRALLNGAAGRLLTNFARSKRQKLLADERYLRSQMELLVRSDKISDALIQEARRRLADPRMDAVITRTPQALRAILTPASALERFEGVCIFGSGPVDRKMRKRIAGAFVESAWSAPMLETPEVIANHLRAIRRG